MLRIGIFVALLCVTFSSFGQVRKLIREGNSEFDKGNFPKSVLIFRQAQAIDTASGDITYNLGNSLYMQKNYQEALGAYQKSLSQEKDPGKQALNYHNVGNALFKAQQYEQSVEAYKKALKLKPNDNETRYNLAMAQQKLKQQQKNNNKDNKDKDKNKKQDKSKENKKEENKDNKDNQQNSNKDQQQKNKEQDQPKISKQDAQRMLDALQTGENNAQERVKAQKVKAQNRRTDKNW